MRSTFSRHVASLITIVVTLAAAGCAKPRRPNILIITIDTLRADHLGCYGYGITRTPAIDRLAREGVRFTDAIAAAPITMPAHTSLFTGLLPPAHGVRDNGAYALGNDAVTLAERLHDAGYTTHAFISALVLNRRYNLNQGFETYDDELWSEDDPKLFMIRERRAPKTADRFLAWLDQWKAEPRKPFFTWIHFFDPHQPYHPAAADLAMAPSPYDAEIMGVDRQIGRIVERLRANKLLDDTLIIVTADHGESLGEHGEQTHAVFVYDATVRVPMIWRYPRAIAPRVCEAPVRSVDVVPTLLKLLALPGGETTQGIDLTPAMSGKPLPPAPQYSESLLSEVGFGMAPLFAIRDGGFKYIRAPRPELYDLRADPRELRNIVAAQPRLAQKLDAELTRVINDSAKHAVKPSSNPMTRETEESLQALGYLAPHGERAGMGGMDPKDGLPIHNKLEQARHLAQRGEWQQAEKLLQEVLAVTPRNVSAINILGLAGIRTGDPAKARAWYERSLAIDPNQFRVYGVLGSVALAQGDLDGAEAECRRAIAVNPNFVEALTNIGFIESLRGHAKEAEAWYAKATAIDPTFPRVHRRLGDLNYERRDYAKALGYYQQVMKLVPNDYRAIVQAGSCERRLGRAGEAMALFRRAEQVHPEGWVATYNRACLEAAMGQPQVALATLSALADRGFQQARLVDNDSDLAAVRKLPQFPAVRKRIGAASDDEGDDAT